MIWEDLKGKDVFKHTNHIRTLGKKSVSDVYASLRKCLQKIIFPCYEKKTEQISKLLGRDMGFLWSNDWEKLRVKVDPKVIDLKRSGVSRTGFQSRSFPLLKTSKVSIRESIL